jgi:hypothetical protein
MASMGNWREGFKKFAAIGVALVIVAGCTTGGATPTPNSPAAAGSTSPFAFGIQSVKSGEPSAAPTSIARSTVPPITVDQITAEFGCGVDYLTPLAHLYGVILSDFCVITVVNNNAGPVKVVVTTQVTGYTSQATDTVTIPAGATQELRQNPRLTTSAIDSLNAPHEADVHVIVSYLQSGEPRTVLDQTSTTNVTSRRDFPWQIQGFTEHQVDELLAVMVTQNDPAVEQLIRTAANYRADHAMGATETAADALDEMSAIWQAESKDYHLFYVNTTETFSAAFQRIRLPGEVLPEASGNCIELTLLYAAVAEALGLKGYLVLIPGHAYFGVDLTGKDDVVIIETTLIRGDTFKDALASGTQEWNDAYPHLQAGESNYDVVDVEAARADGVLPIPWH